MNAAIRILDQRTVSQSITRSIALTKAHVMLSLLGVALLVSALSLVYVTNATRSLNASIQQMLAERDHMHVQWGQLLLQKSTAVMQARVEQVAESQLGMMVPNHKSVVIVNE